MLIDHWPLLGLRLITPRLELRLPSDAELSELAARLRASEAKLKGRRRLDTRRGA